MKILIVETSPLSAANDVTVHVRNSVELQRHLSLRHDCRLVSSENHVEDLGEQFDYIIFVSATFYFEFKPYVKLMKNQRHCKIGWLTNEFELFCNDFLRGKIDFMIANFEEHGVKKAHMHDKFLMTNLNALQARPRNPPTEKKYDLCYYGTYRKYRAPYFMDYFKGDIVLSTSGKNVKKFQILQCDCWLADKFSWEAGRETLNWFRGSLYIEDTKTHTLFNHMANRFFEGLFCNCAILFDVHCKGTIERDVYSVPKDLIVESYEEAMDKARHIDRALLEDFLSSNTAVALREKRRCLGQVEQFLVNY